MSNELALFFNEEEQNRVGLSKLGKAYIAMALGRYERSIDMGDSRKEAREDAKHFFFHT